MGQYDYRGTPQSRMYDWLVTREGDSLRLCVDEEPPREVEIEDLEYLRTLVRADSDDTKSIFAQGEIPGVITDAAAQDAVENAKRPVPERDPDAPAPATGGVDYYDMEGKGGIPQALGPAPPPTRRHLDEDGKWQEGDRPPFTTPVVKDPKPAGPAEIRRALGLDEPEEENDA